MKIPTSTKPACTVVSLSNTFFKGCNSEQTCSKEWSRMGKMKQTHNFPIPLSPFLTKRQTHPIERTRGRLAGRQPSLWRYPPSLILLEENTTLGKVANTTEVETAAPQHSSYSFMSHALLWVCLFQIIAPIAPPLWVWIVIWQFCQFLIRDKYLEHKPDNSCRLYCSLLNQKEIYVK